MNELKLHDIKPLVEIPDVSIYYFSALVAGIVALLVLVAWGVYRFLKRKQAVDLQKEYRALLHAIELGHTKNAAYELTFYGDLIEKDTEQTAYYEAMIEALEAFKYRKTVASFDALTLEKISRFRDAIDG